jgi:membrane fusion protein (multidrug efflux system)
MLRVAMISPIRLQANVAESDLSLVRVGGRAEVQIAGSGGVIPARISSVAPQVDPTSRTGTVEVTLPNSDGRILPGQFVSLELILSYKASALQIAKKAVVPSAREDAGTVWIAETGAGGLIARAKNVLLGASNAEKVEVVSGIHEGDHIITTGFEYLKDGDPVMDCRTDLAKKPRQRNGAHRNVVFDGGGR